MRHDRPSTLDELRRDRMHQLVGGAAERAKAAQATLEQGRDFRKAAATNLSEGLRLPAVSALHESARLAVAAVAAHEGYRFSNTAGAHEATVDYALAIRLVNRQQYAQLDQLRDLRNHVNYPEDLIAPPPREIEQYSALVDTLLALAEERIHARKVPPPPKRANS